MTTLYGFYRINLVLLSVSSILSCQCENDNEIGGRHGDLEMASEESFDEAIDLPPGVSDPMDIRKALEENPDNPYFAWSHIYPKNKYSGSGHVFFAEQPERSNSRIARATLTNFKSRQKLKMVLSSQHCHKNLEQLSSEPANVGTFQVDRQGRTRSQRINFTAEAIPKNYSLKKCKNSDTYVWLVAGDEGIACGKLSCLQKQAPTSQ